jgi:large subunit ribosomal protein L1
MLKMTKRMQLVCKNIDTKKLYDAEEALALLKEHSTVKFKESVDVSINLGIDARKSDQNVRGVVLLPHGIGRSVRVAVFVCDSEAQSAKDAGADLVGLEDLAKQIKGGSINFDVAIASPEAMPVVGQLGQILGPRGLMPNPKFGTVTSDIAKAVLNAKKGQIRYRNDKSGIIHTTIGQVNFSIEHLKENLQTLLNILKKDKPSSSKGIYIKKISLSTTMGIGIKIEQSSLVEK